MEEIKSVKNPTVRWMRTLRERKGREESGAFLVEGRKMIEEARNAGLRALCLLAVEELREFAAGFDRAALVPDFVLEAVCDTKTPQGACAAFEMPKTIPLEAAPERLVALDGVQDPGNVGTIWRTADAGRAFRASCWERDARTRCPTRYSARQWGRAFAFPRCRQQISPRRWENCAGKAGRSSPRRWTARIFIAARKWEKSAFWSSEARRGAFRPLFANRRIAW